MSSPDAFSAFKAVLDGYVAGPGGLPVRYENQFCQDLIDADTPAWVYVEIYGDTYRQDTTGAPGANVWEETGVTFAHIMCRAARGALPRASMPPR